RDETPGTHRNPLPPRPTAGGHLLELSALRVRRGDRMLPPVDLTATPGTVTLIEGPSGAGKSSVFAALRGAATFDGAATWAGTDIRDLAPSEWLAWAGQRPGLLAGTIADNVTLGDPAPEASTVRAALDLACAGSLDPAQELGVQGSGLSGGQAQRVAVARAFYRHLRGVAQPQLSLDTPPSGTTGTLIALDEPSSALDPDTEARLWRGIRHLADEGATVLLISHRTSARQIADTVVRLEPIEVLA
ncbi:ATP-binding cassette domain-containing protein, partial [Microbacterium sp. B35-04]|uniref:ATP-binding cassette domain-containing protein n=1 Tax=Microbacterium sp. B35-04 TaxID=1961716 RepID=UPI0013D64EDF